MLKLALWFGGLVAVLGIGAWLWFSGMLEPLLSEVGLSEMQQEEAPDTANQQPQSELTTGTDTSDQALEDDLGALDAQLNAYSETSAELDQSLSDTPIQQEY